MKIVDMLRMMLSDQLIHWAVKVAPECEDKQELAKFTIGYMSRSIKRAEQELGETE